jgi:hypothetical protein
MVDRLKALDPDRPIREADIDQPALTDLDLWSDPAIDAVDD